MKHHPELEEKRNFRRVLGVVIVAHVALAGIPLAWLRPGSAKSSGSTAEAQIQWIEPTLIPEMPHAAPEPDELVARVISRTPVIENVELQSFAETEAEESTDFALVAKEDTPIKSPPAKAQKPKVSKPVRLFNRKNQVTQSSFHPEPPHATNAEDANVVSPAEESISASAGETPGEPSGAEQDAILSYHNKIQQIFEQRWSQPKNAASGTPAAKISLSILRSGKINHFQLAESSGNAAVDQSAINAVRSVSEIDPLPTVIRSDNYQLLVKFVLH